jgi:hypothetical protein
MEYQSGSLEVQRNLKLSCNRAEPGNQALAEANQPGWLFSTCGDYLIEAPLGGGKTEWVGVQGARMK